MEVCTLTESLYNFQWSLLSQTNVRARQHFLIHIFSKFKLVFSFYTERASAFPGDREGPSLLISRTAISPFLDLLIARL